MSETDADDYKIDFNAIRESAAIRAAEEAEMAMTREPDALTADDLAHGTSFLTLGPAYFAARRIAERQMAAFQSEMFKPLIDKFAKEFGERLWEDVQNSLLSDVEMNLQHEMWHTLDAIVGALLGGERWALEKYVLGPRYEQDRIRAAVAVHIPKELQDARITDLEAELARAKKDVEVYRQRY